MKKKSILYCLAAGAAAAMILLLLFTRPSSGGGEESGNRILSREEFAQRKEEAVEIPFSARQLRWQGGEVPCDASSGTVYIPVETWSTGGDTGSGPSSKEAEAGAAAPAGGRAETSFLEEILTGLTGADADSVIYFQEDDMCGDLSAAVREGHGFQAILVTPEGASSFQAVFTGLPALCIWKTDENPVRRKEEHEARIRMVPLLQGAQGAENGRNPVSGGFSAKEEQEAREMRCLFHVRGNVSSTLKKKPYKISLLDEAGNKADAGWLGLREDDDWILNPLYTDSTRVREQTAYALWQKVEELSEKPVASSRMRYVEVFLDDAYQGVYALTEPVDAKQLGLAPGDLLYKIDRWDREYPYLDLYGEKEAAREPEILNDHGYPCVEIRWPKTWDSTASWGPMEAFHRFVFRTGDPETLREAGLTVEMETVVTLSLFCAMTHAEDNGWKNSFLEARRDADGYTLFRTIWDLNYVFGDIFVYKPEDGYTVFDAGTALCYTPYKDSTYDYEAFAAADPALEESLRALWARWREGGISAEYVIGLLRQYREELVRSGALRRETACWQQGEDGGAAMEKTETWIRQRFLFLDGYFRYAEQGS
ncbi:MAG: CotH kinase family protein [Eubacteriales bacterium]|nr:CotH kinase family protein [Eubacteriales bacterium]